MASQTPISSLSSENLVKLQNYKMFSRHVGPRQEIASMQCNNLYEWNFSNIVQAFLKKYNERTKTHFFQVTICHVEQIDEDTFAFVRRMENKMS